MVRKVYKKKKVRNFIKVSLKVMHFKLLIQTFLGYKFSSVGIIIGHYIINIFNIVFIISFAMKTRHLVNYISLINAAEHEFSEESESQPVLE